MGRPPGARKALGRFPLVEARRAHFSGIERVPFESASAEPLDFVAGRPAAEKTADARGSEVVGFFSSSSSGTTTGLSATVLTTVIMT